MLIGDVARRSGISARMLRHYDDLGLLVPTGRTSGGYRDYSAGDLRRLLHVECLRTLGMPLSDVKKALDDPGFTPAASVGELVEHTRARIRTEEELLARLEQIDAAGPADWTDVLQVVSLVRALESDSGARRQYAALTHGGEAPIPVEALVEALLAEDDANVAGALQWVLARAGSDMLPALGAALTAADPEVRRRAVDAIVTVPGPVASALLVRALDDPDTGTRGRAALELGERGSAEAVGVLVDLVVEGRRDVEAAEILGALADDAVPADRIVAELRRRLGDDSDAAAKIRLAQALAEIPGRAARGALAELAQDDARTVALTAGVILGRDGS